MKEKTYKQIYKNCNFRDICECGQAELCYHPEAEEGFCEKELCPKLKIGEINEKKE